MSGGSTASQVVLTIFIYILEHRLFLIALNLIIGAVLLLLICSIPWLRRRGITYRWFRLLVREERADRLSSVGDAETQQTYISLGTLSRVSFHSSLSSRTPSPPPNNPFLDPEIADSNTRRSPDGSSITPFIAENTNTSLSRSDSEGSKRFQEPASSTTTTWQRPLEPLRRPVVEGHESMNTFPSYMTTPSLLTSQTTNAESLSIDISDLEIPETPVSLTSEGIPSEGPVSGTPGRNRPPTYATTFSHQSVMTLPLYREADDNRASVASLAPTYKSTATAHSPHSFRSTRPPLPRPPLPRPPLPRPPSPLPPPSSYPQIMTERKL